MNIPIQETTMTTILTYHCLCTELVLVTPSGLDALRKREGDGALICKLSLGEGITLDSSIFTSAVTVEDTPIVLNLEDGFEKRYPARCARCGLMLGYQLDLCQWQATKEGKGRRQDVVFIIPGGLMSTEDLAAGSKLGDSEVEVKVSG